MFPDTIDEYLMSLQRVSPPNFSLEDIPGFPYTEYQRNMSRYNELYSWYSGQVLDEISETSDNKEVQVYPVRVNPIPSACLKHVHTLFGEVTITDRPPVFPRVSLDSIEEHTKKIAREAEEILYQTWWENNSYSIMIENAFMSQIYGGCIFKLRWDIINPMRTVPIAIDVVHPANFIGIPDPNDMWSLSEAWFVRPISDIEMQNYEVARTENYSDVHWLIERITKTRIDVMIDGKPAVYKLPDGGRELSGVNPFGFVPAIYIPHNRVFGFYGTGIIENVKGIVKELNLRIADFGDAVNADAHTYLGMRFVQGTPSVQRIAPNLYTINLQSMPSITGSESQPDLFDFRKPAASAAMQNLYNILYDQYRRDAFVPAIADGEDEGSQRSGLTLAMRMWPLVSHTNIERYFWTSGLNILNRMILKMLFVKKEKGITSEHAEVRIRQQWYPPLPRDREQQVNEAVARMGSMLGSPQHLIDMLGDVEDPDEEVLKILSFYQEKSSIDSTARVMAQPEEEDEPNTRTVDKSEKDDKE